MIVSLILMMSIAFSTLLSAETKVLAFAASLRKDSQNKKLIKEAAFIAREQGALVTVIDLADYSMPFYDGDLEASQGMPANAKKLRQLMMQSDVILIASPEYNGSVPGLLKNAIDWASRDENGRSSRAAFQGKRFGIMSASPGKSGGKRGLVHLQAIIQDIGGTVLTKQVTVSFANSAFNEEGHLKDPQLNQELRELIAD